MRARSALFTLFGDVVRPCGGEAWLPTLTACMEALGFTPEATRTALHRMAGEGWVAQRRSGRYAAYRLTARGVERLEAAAARIYRLRAIDWDGRWRLLALTGDGGRPGPDLARALGWSGYGRLAAETWVSPHPHPDRILGLLADHGRAGAHRFTAAGAGGAAEDRRIVAAAWDLAELRDAQAAFLARWRDHRPARDAVRAFRERIELVHHWRSFLFLDPGLPATLLPADWLGEEAAALFRARYEALEGPSWAFVDDAAARGPGGPGALERLQPTSPFALGLDLDARPVSRTR